MTKRKKITLTDNDIDKIKQSAHRNWIYDASTGDDFVCRCTVKAFIDFIASKNYTVKDGQIYEQEQDT